MNVCMYRFMYHEIENNVWYYNIRALTQEIRSQIR